MEFSKETVAGKAVLEIDVTEKDVYYIVVGALEQGSTYWVGLDNRGEEFKNREKGVHTLEVVTKLLLDGKSVTLYDIENEQDTWELTLEKLLKGVAQYKKERPSDSDLESADAETYDCILQYAIFEELVYG